MESLRLYPLNVGKDTLSVAFDWIFQRESDAVGDLVESVLAPTPGLADSSSAIFSLRRSSPFSMCSRPASRRPGSAASIRSIAGPIRRIASSRRSVTHLPASAFCSGERRRSPSPTQPPSAKVVPGLLLAVGVTLLMRLPLGPQAGRGSGPRVARLRVAMVGLDPRPIAEVLRDLLITGSRGIPGSVRACPGPFTFVAPSDLPAPPASPEPQLHQASPRRRPGRPPPRITTLAMSAIAIGNGRRPGPVHRNVDDRDRVPFGPSRGMFGHQRGQFGSRGGCC